MVRAEGSYMSRSLRICGRSILECLAELAVPRIAHSVVAKCLRERVAELLYSPSSSPCDTAGRNDSRCAVIAFEVDAAELWIDTMKFSGNPPF